jgi:Uma2 family endonuclease
MRHMAASTAPIWAPAPPEHWYLTDDFNMPVTADTQRRENTLQSVFEAHVARHGRDASILANVAFRWDQAHPGVGVDPDILWLEPALPEGRRSVLTWEEGTGVPRLAVEVVGRDTAHKDYNHGPGKYAASGVDELWVFDPDGFGRRDDGDGPHLLQVWRRPRRSVTSPRRSVTSPRRSVTSPRRSVTSPRRSEIASAFVRRRPRRGSARWRPCSPRAADAQIGAVGENSALGKSRCTTPSAQSLLNSATRLPSMSFTQAP